MSDNPFYLELTRHSGWPSKRGARWLSGVIAVVVSALAVASLYIVWTRQGLGVGAILWLTGAGPIYAVLAPTLALIWTVLLTTPHTAPDSLSLLRLTDVSAQQILDAYVDAARHRLRLLRVIGLGLLLPTAILLSLAIGTFTMIIDCLYPGCGPTIIFAYLIYGSIPGIFVTGVLFGIGAVLYRLAIIVGVWISLRWRQNAVGIAGGISLLVWALVLALGWLSILFARPTLACIGGGLLVIVLAIIALPIWILMVEKYARRAVEAS